MYTRGRGDRFQKKKYAEWFCFLEGAKVRQGQGLFIQSRSYMVKVLGERKGKEKKRAELL